MCVFVCLSACRCTSEWHAEVVFCLSHNALNTDMSDRLRSSDALSKQFFCIDG